jgi:hypothetical protein
VAEFIEGTDAPVREQSVEMRSGVVGDEEE